MAEQNYSNHRRFVAGFHFVLSTLLFLAFVGALIQVYRAWQMQREPGRVGAHPAAVDRRGSSSSGSAGSSRSKRRTGRSAPKRSCATIVLAGEMPDARLDTRQFVGLRFAGDEEFPALAKRAAEEGMSENEIKKAVQSWRGDTYRV